MSAAGVSSQSRAVDGVKLQIAAMMKRPRHTTVFLHGFGSTEEDYADLACDAELTARVLHRPLRHRGGGRDIRRP